MEYNTNRTKLVLPEYGRNIHNLVNHAKTIEDKEERNDFAKAIISIMGSMNPHLRDINDFKHKLWDHLALMANFELEIDSPYPKPTKETFESKPKRVPYSDRKIKYRFFGKTIQLMINKAIEYPEGDEKELLINVITNHMKKSYIMWNKDTVDDEVIFKAVKEMSGGKLQIKDDLKLTESREIINRNKRKRIPKKK